jgi:hypothetical protein
MDAGVNSLPPAGALAIMPSYSQSTHVWGRARDMTRHESGGVLGQDDLCYCAVTTKDMQAPERADHGLLGPPTASHVCPAATWWLPRSVGAWPARH